MNALEAVEIVESGRNMDSETIEAMQFLVDTGLAWQLQGSYGRLATSMIDAGLVTDPRSRGSE